MAGALTMSDGYVSRGAAGYVGGAGTGDAYFKSSSVVALAALLCALTIVLELNSMARAVPPLPRRRRPGSRSIDRWPRLQWSFSTCRRSVEVAGRWSAEEVAGVAAVVGDGTDVVVEARRLAPLVL